MQSIHLKKIKWSHDYHMTRNLTTSGISVIKGDTEDTVSSASETWNNNRKIINHTLDGCFVAKDKILNF